MFNYITAECVDGTVRLVGGISESNGRVEYATGECGAQCVMMIGTTVMQQWCAGSWAIVQLVSLRKSYIEYCTFSMNVMHCCDPARSV